VPDRSHLGEYLRARREQLQPADVGLPPSGRRRTPGLRREEVATLAGVSIDYLVRLEQGRDVNPSAAVLASLAAALRLDDDERMHLFKLAAMSGASELCPAARAAAVEIPASIRQLLDRLVPTPAFVLGAAGDVLAANRSWETIVRPLGLLDDPAPNLVRYLFLDARAKDVYTDWADVADGQVAALRQAGVRAGPSVAFDALIEELLHVPEFASRWAAHAVAEKRRGAKRVMHPTVGELHVMFETLLLPDDAYLRLVTWLPADEQSASALLTAAAGTGGRLRVVGEA
jgi:transcriptional regulator with XRE-family HTH domain